MAERQDRIGGRHLREALRKRESPREKEPRKENVKWGTIHSKRVVRN